MSKFNSEKFFQDHQIPFYPAGTKNVPKGHIGINCPFCGDQSHHLIFNLEGWFCKCWRCGKKNVNQVVSVLLKIPYREAEAVSKQYKDSSGPTVRNVFERKRGSDKVKFPSGCGPLLNSHLSYLSKRNFDPYEIQSKWGILGTNHLDFTYRHRIIIPIYYHHKLVSFHSRDITGLQEPKYVAAKPDNEVILHKNLLYGFDYVSKNSIVVVEGPTDVWRLGYGSVCTFGTQWTVAQASILIEYFNKIFIIFDKDEPGQKGGLSLYGYLKGFGKDVQLLQLESDEDPGSMNNSDARYLMEKYLKVR